MIATVPFSQPVKIELTLYKRPRYEVCFNPSIKAGLMNVISLDIVNGIDGLEIEADADERAIDPLHEYLVLHYSDGEKATFRMSYTDVHIIN